MSEYCDFVKQFPVDHPHRRYHDEEYGFPLFDDNELFGRLILEINQAGLNWLTILKKKDRMIPHNVTSYYLPLR